MVVSRAGRGGGVIAPALHWTIINKIIIVKIWLGRYRMQWDQILHWQNIFDPNCLGFINFWWWWKRPEIVVSQSKHLIGGGGGWRRKLNIWDICRCIVSIVSHIVMADYVQHNAEHYSKHYGEKWNSSLLMMKRRSVKEYKSIFANRSIKQHWHFASTVMYSL